MFLPPPHFCSVPGPLLMSLKPGSKLHDSYLDSVEAKAPISVLEAKRSQTRPGQMQLAHVQETLEAKEGREPKIFNDLKSWQGDSVQDKGVTPVTNGREPLLCSPPKTENEVLDMVSKMVGGVGLNLTLCYCLTELCFPSVVISRHSTCSSVHFLTNYHGGNMGGVS